MPRLLQRLAGRLARLLAPAKGQALASCERLEQREFLSSTPLPTLSMLENPNHPVIRFETNFGDIDLEMFSTNAPITVFNFLNYVNSGRLDETFFHRLSKKTDPGGLGGLDVIQGGGFAYDNRAGLSTVPTDAPIRLEQTGKSNVAGTISMARTNDPNSATSQFFLNVTDNTTLDSTGPNNGFVVFGRVIQGASVLQSIYALDRPDLSTDPALAGDFESNFQFTPVTSAFNSVAGVRENALVSIINADLIKVQDFAGFLDQTLVMPEGFRSPTTTEIVNLTNPNNTPMRYEVTVRYEVGGNDVNFNPGARDQRVASGTINANSSLRITLSSTETGFTSFISDNAAYSVIITSGAADSAGTVLPLGATFERRDFGASTSEAFIDPTLLTDAEKRSWSFARIERNENSLEFLLLYNDSPAINTATVTIYTGSSTRTVTRVLDAYKRGGVFFGDLGLADNAFSVRVTSTQNLIAYVSDWDTPRESTPAADAYTPGWMVSGTFGGGSTTGALAQVDVRPNFSNTISILNATNSTTTVQFSIWRLSRAAGEQPITRSEVVLARSRVDLDLSSFGTFSAGEPLSITYSSPAPVTVQFTSVDEEGRGLAGKRSDGIAAAFSTRLASTVVFGEGSFDPDRVNATQNEVISIFNPSGTEELNYTASYLFSDGTAIDVPGVLPAAQRFDVRTSTVNPVLAKIRSGTQFRTYGIRVTGILNDGAGAIGTPGIVSLVKRDTTLGFSTMSTGFIYGPLATLDPTGVPGPGSGI
jgi:cyclophilin family peptidyl-prolyl cis-trans isomerase